MTDKRTTLEMLADTGAELITLRAENRRLREALRTAKRQWNDHVAAADDLALWDTIVEHVQRRRGADRSAGRRALAEELIDE